MNTTSQLIIKTRQVNVWQNDNKIIYIIKRLQPQLQGEYCMQTIAQIITSNAVMLQVSADICLLLPRPTWGLQMAYTSWILHLIQSSASN